MFGILASALGAAGFGAANIVIKKSLSDISVAQTMMMSTLSGFVFLGLLVLIKGLGLNHDSAFLLKTFLLAIVEVTIYFTLYRTFAVNNVAVATGILNTYPILSLLVTWIVFHQELAAIKLLWVLLIVVGTILLTVDFKALGKEKIMLKGLPWLAACFILHGFYFPVLGNFTAQQSWEVSLMMIKFFSAIILFFFYGVYKRQKLLPPAEKVPFTSLLGFLEMIGWSGLAWGSTMAAGQLGLVVAAQNSSAMFTAIFAYFTLGERLTKLQLAGMGVIVAALTGLAL